MSLNQQGCSQLTHWWQLLYITIVRIYFTIRKWYYERPPSLLSVTSTTRTLIRLSFAHGPPTHSWFAPVKPLFMLAMVVSYLLQFYVPAFIFTRLMEKLRFHREASERQRYINIKLMRIILVLFTCKRFCACVACRRPYLTVCVCVSGAVFNSFMVYCF